MNVLSRDQRIAILRHLTDGCGTRQTARLVGVRPNTITSYLIRYGTSAAKILDERIKDMTCNHIALDEQWSFVRIKSRNMPKNGRESPHVGDVWIFLAQDVQSRLILSHLVDKRTGASTRRFVADLASRMRSPTPHQSDDHHFHTGEYRRFVQLSSDASESYRESIDSSFGRHQVLYAQIVKATSSMEKSPDKWAERRAIFGPVNPDTANTSYIERLNLTNRTLMRRLNRRSLCFSKKIECFRAAVALHLVHYNWCWVPRKINGVANYKTPAMLASLETRQWSVDNLYEQLTN